MEKFVIMFVHLTLEIKNSIWEGGNTSFLEILYAYQIHSLRPINSFEGF